MNEIMTLEGPGDSAEQPAANTMPPEKALAKQRSAVETAIEERDRLTKQAEILDEQRQRIEERRRISIAAGNVGKVADIDVELAANNAERARVVTLASNWASTQALAGQLARNTRTRMALEQLRQAAETQGNAEAAQVIGRLLADVGKLSSDLLETRNKQVEAWTSQKSLGDLGLFHSDLINTAQQAINDATNRVQGAANSVVNRVTEPLRNPYVAGAIDAVGGSGTARGIANSLGGQSRPPAATAFDPSRIVSVIAQFRPPVRPSPQRPPAPPPPPPPPVPSQSLLDRIPTWAFAAGAVGVAGSVVLLLRRRKS